MQTSWHNNSFLHLDYLLLSGLILLFIIGLATLYSAGGQNLDLIFRQILRFLVGFGVLLLLAQIRTQKIIGFVPWIYMLGILVLILVLVIGESTNGSQRWINLGLFRFQPSEIMKLAVPMMVTWYLTSKPLPPTYGRLLGSLAIIFVPVLLIMKQPDLGTSLLIASSGVFVLLLAGLSWKIVFGLLSSMVLAAPGLWTLLHEYQRDRIRTFLDPERDPLGNGYHIIQSKIAIGSGGFSGKGWLNGTQSHLQFLPERSTDFIFAVYSEELGLLGVLVLLTIYFLVLSRGMYIALKAQDSFARLLAGSLTLTFFVYIFVNMSMVSGLLPVVGLPLPLISYGGTSLVTLMAGFGLIMAIHTHRRLLSN
ncbi:MAG: rod shape-determining protein RodA [Candidatus Marithrix sp.]